MKLQLDPWQVEKLADWRNRFAEFAESPAEPLFHSAIYLALCLMLALIFTTSLRTSASTINSLLLEWRWTASFLMIAFFGFLQIRSLNKRVRTRLNGWLSAQPIAHHVWVRNARISAAWLCVMQLVSVSVIGYSILASLGMFLAGLSCVLVSGFLVSIRPELWCTSFTQSGTQRAVIGGPGIGCVWRWQLIEAKQIFGPKRFASMFALMLLLPSNSRLSMIVFLLFAILTFALLADAWRISLAVLPTAYRWMATQPVTAKRLFFKWVQLPAIIIGASITLAVLTLSSLGALKLIGLFTIVILMFSGLAIACVAAERKNPRRIGVILAFHVFGLLIIFQALPPGALVIWPLQMLWLLRRGLAER
jgi:hypothetical protein